MRIVALATLLLLVGCSEAQSFKPQQRDIFFHTSRSSQSAAIQLATGSRYSHMGMIFWEYGSPLVFEAVEPVKATPLDQWIARGDGGHFVVKRLVDADEVLTGEALERMLTGGHARQWTSR